MGAGQGFLLSAFLMKRKINPLPNKIWGITVVTFSFDMLMVCFHNSGLYLEYPHLMGLSAPFPLLYGPLVFLYTSFAGLKYKRLPLNCYIHFIPFLLFLIWGIFAVYNQSADFKIALIQKEIDLPILSFFTILIPIQGCTYMLLSFFKLKELKNKIKQNYSFIDNFTFNQINNLIYGNMIIWFLVIVSYLVERFIPIEFEANVIIYIPIAILIFNLGWKSLHSPELDLLDSKKDNKDEENFKSSKKDTSYKKSGLSETDAKYYLVNLITYMKEKKPFCDSNLKLTDLAFSIGITSHNLSEILNTHLNQTFYDFVNSYRVNEVKELIEFDSKKNLSLISIAFEAGFSSKSSFNTTFKKFEGVTPSEYRKDVLN